MNKVLTTVLCLCTMLTTMAQTEISGLLDANPSDGITGTPAGFNGGSFIQACRDLVHDGKSDWYIPSVEEALLFVIDGHATDYLTRNMPGCTGTNCNQADKYFYTRTHHYHYSTHAKVLLGVSGIGVPINIVHSEIIVGDNGDVRNTDSRTHADLSTNYLYHSSSATTNTYYVRCVR